MTTRLDRILNLLATGSNASVKATAARQLGTIAAQSASKNDVDSWKEVVQLLTRVLPYIHHKQWETRIAAGKAVEAICQEAGVWSPVLQESDGELKPFLGGSQLDQFDLVTLLSSSTPTLLASSGNEYKNVTVDASLNKKQEMLSNLGLAGFGDDDFLDNELGTEMDEAKTVIKKEQMLQQPVASTSKLPPVASSPAKVESDEMEGLSARERNALKRKRKADGKGPVATKPKLENASLSTAPSSSAPEQVVVGPKQATKVDALTDRPELDLYLPEADHWPFHKLCSYLSDHLSHSAWELRHGSALALLNILKSQGIYGGKKHFLSSSANSQLHSIWTQDLSNQVLKVLCLDRFGDYVGDSVVAPVRETCSMLLAALIKLIDLEGSTKVLSVLMGMVKQEGVEKYVWQVRHAGLSGLKYLVAVREELFADEKTLRDLVEVACTGLQDQDDDVRSAAASALSPLTGSIIVTFPEKIVPLLNILWTNFADLKDDLSHSIASIMTLLSSLLAHDTVVVMLASSLLQLCPLLYPYFRHTITTVRLEVLSTLKLFISINNSWITDQVLSLLFQNIVLEEKPEIRLSSLQVFEEAIATVPFSFYTSTMMNWLNIALTPLGTPLNDALFVRPAGIFTAGGSLDRATMEQDMSLVAEVRIVSGRLAAAKALARVAICLPLEQRDELFTVHLLNGLKSSPSAFQRFLIAVLIEEWALVTPNFASLSTTTTNICQTLQAELESPLTDVFELSSLLNTVQSNCQAIYNGFITAGQLKEPELPLLAGVQAEMGFGISIAEQVIGPSYNALLHMLNIEGTKGKAKTKKQELLPRLEEKKNQVTIGIEMYKSNKERWDVQTGAAFAGAYIATRAIPNKLNPLIKGVMNSIKFEDNVQLQERSAAALARFINYASSSDSGLRANPSDKLVKNLCTFVCQDTTQTPIFIHFKDTSKGILSLPDRPVPGEKIGSVKGITVPTESDESLRNKRIRRGAESALNKLCLQVGGRIFDQLPRLWSCMSETLLSMYSTAQPIQMSDQNGQDLLDNLTVLATVVPQLDLSLQPMIDTLFEALGHSIKSPLPVIRQATAKCLASLCDVLPLVGLRHVVLEMLTYMGDPLHIHYRRGVIELVSHLVEKLGIKILPYVIFLVVPVLGRMTDADEETRVVATTTFANLIKLVPLEAGLPDPPGFSKSLLAKRDEERQFLVQLLDGSKIDNYEVSVPIKADLRKYQKEGVSWLAFLAKFQLHGILCDDMGLGKTLQTICILASQTYDRSVQHEKTKSPDSVHLPSLVICPPTLTGHWVHEIQTYTSTLRPALYGGDKATRARTLASRNKIDVLVMSYDVARNDIANIQKCQFNYCVLDEGHIIKNGKTKLAQALKLIQANHRLILSGTPIQNNLLELWSLFDFLMPGFLGTEKSFNEKYSKPVQASREAKSSGKEQAAGTLALDALHKQVLPFLLRRLKEDVLDDLPPKIIQDYHCDLSPLQKIFYDEHAKSNDGEGVNDTGNQHVFQSLQYLRKLVNHPLLVVKPELPGHQALLSRMSGQVDLHDISHAPKLIALRQILQDCGIGKIEDGTDDTVAPHRVLVFCQMKQMLDIIETDLFRAMMPTVTYMRLDGTTPSNKRHALVQAFNADPSIDVLLLTTHVGGLGLNLTSADTVIFVEHDWNPMKDLQAMDRAHRLGQKRVVNVYRLITRGSLEEKIMGLQRFKLNIASSVVNQQNANLSTMETDQLLDLFDVASGTDSVKDKRRGEKKVSQQELLDGLGELQEDEYGFEDAASFAAGL